MSIAEESTADQKGFCVMAAARFFRDRVGWLEAADWDIWERRNGWPLALQLTFYKISGNKQYLN